MIELGIEDPSTGLLLLCMSVIDLMGIEHEWMVKVRSKVNECLDGNELGRLGSYERNL